MKTANLVTHGMKKKDEKKTVVIEPQKNKVRRVEQ